MSEFKYNIPEEKLPKNVNHESLVRGIKTIPPTKDDFEPTFISSISKFERFINGSVFEDIGDYSLSVFTSVDNFEYFFNNKVSPTFNKKHIGYALGHSNELLGITGPADSDGHVDYFLFDPNDDKIMEDFSTYETRKSK